MASRGGDPDPFTRRPRQEMEADPFDAMREQMEKERENFFRGVNPRDWPEGGSVRPGGFPSRVSANKNKPSGELITV